MKLLTFCILLVIVLIVFFSYLAYKNFTSGDNSNQLEKEAINIAE